MSRPLRCDEAHHVPDVGPQEKVPVPWVGDCHSPTDSSSKSQWLHLCGGGGGVFISENSIQGTVTAAISTHSSFGMAITGRLGSRTLEGDSDKLDISLSLQ